MACVWLTNCAISCSDCSCCSTNNTSNTRSCEGVSANAIEFSATQRVTKHLRTQLASQYLWWRRNRECTDDGPEAESALRGWAKREWAYREFRRESGESRRRESSRNSDIQRGKTEIKAREAISDAVEFDGTKTATEVKAEKMRVHRK